MIRRFFPDLPGSACRLELDENHYRHLIRVLRMTVGDQFILFDSNGFESSAQIQSIGNKKLFIEVDAPEKIDREPRCDVTLAVAMPKGEKIDLVLQKGTELGVSRFFLFISTHSVSRPQSDKIDNKIERFRQIIESASAQSGRGKLPDVKFFHDFSQMLGNISSVARYCLSPGAKELLANKINPLPESVALLIGPEGGLVEEEEEKAKGYGFQKVRFSRLIYRSETAAIAAVVPFVLDSFG